VIHVQFAELRPLLDITFHNFVKEEVMHRWHLQDGTETNAQFLPDWRRQNNERGCRQMGHALSTFHSPGISRAGPAWYRYGFESCNL
jgi:hypothetical protein